MAGSGATGVDPQTWLEAETARDIPLYEIGWSRRRRFGDSSPIFKVDVPEEEHVHREGRSALDVANEVRAFLKAADTEVIHTDPIEHFEGIRQDRFDEEPGLPDIRRSHPGAFEKPGSKCRLRKKIGGEESGARPRPRDWRRETPQGPSIFPLLANLSI